MYYENFVSSLCALFRGMEYLKTCVASPKNLENLGEFLVFYGAKRRKFLCQKVCDEKINVKKFIIKILMSVS